MKTKYLEPNNVLKLIVFCLIYRSVATAKQGLFSVTYWDKYIYGILCCIILSVALAMKKNFKFTFTREELKIGKWIISPVLISWIYTMLITTFIVSVPYSGYTTRALSNLIFPVLSLTQGLLMFKYFGHETINLTFYAYVLSYITSVIVAYSQGGIIPFILMLTDSGYNSSVLEMSELSPALCVFMIYFLYEYRYRNLSKRKLIFREIICLFILIIGMKRILILSSAILLVVYAFMRKRVEKIGKWSTVFTWIIILTSYIFVWSIRSGAMFSFLEGYNINSMARNYFWKAIENTYTFSPFFLGRGIGFAGKWMDNNWRSMDILGMNQSTGIHSDILKFYIELGFGGFVLYLYTYLKIITNKIRKLLDCQSAFVYFMLMLLQVLCWFTDNISGYHIILWPLYMILFCLIYDAKKISL